MGEIVGISTTGDAVAGTSDSGAGVRGVSTNGVGVAAQGTPAGSFDGPVEVTGEVTVGDTVSARHLVATGGNISAAGNVNAGDTVNTQHLSAQGNVSALGNVNADTVNTNRVVSQGDINTNTTVNTLHLVAAGNISAIGNVNAGATVNTQHLSAQGNVSAIGNVNAQSVNVTDTVVTQHVSARGNVSALGNVNARNVNVEIDIVLLNADCAEEFDAGSTGAELTPGTVVVLDVDGSVQRSESAYDTRVAGIVSGGGDYRPGLILDRRSDRSSPVPVAMMGKVSCNVDATYGTIELGDLLTSSPTPGYAMKATDPARAFGSVIGKAMRRLSDGQGMIPVLVALQ